MFLFAVNKILNLYIYNCNHQSLHLTSPSHLSHCQNATSRQNVCYTNLQSAKKFLRHLCQMGYKLFQRTINNPSSGLNSKLEYLLFATDCLNSSTTLFTEGRGGKASLLMLPYVVQNLSSHNTLVSHWQSIWTSNLKVICSRPGSKKIWREPSVVNLWDLGCPAYDFNLKPMIFLPPEKKINVRCKETRAAKAQPLGLTTAGRNHIFSQLPESLTEETPISILFKLISISMKV